MHINYIWQKLINKLNIMKTNFLKKAIVLTAIITVLVSCGKKDDDVKNKADIVGEWTMKSLKSTTTINSTVKGKTFETKITANTNQTKVIFAFNKNKEIHANGTYNLKITAVVNGKTSTSEMKDQKIVGMEGTWKIKGNKLNITGKDKKVQEYVINLLTKKELKLSLVKNKTNTISGVTTKEKTSTIIELTRK